MLYILQLIFLSIAVAQDCRDFEDSGYFCVPQNQCIEGVIDTSGSNLLTIRQASKPLDSTALESFCPSLDTQNTCCFDSGGSPQPPEQPDKEGGPQGLKAQICGVHNPNGIQGVRADSPRTAHFGEFPHVCAILSRTILKGKVIKQYEGVASLITWDVLLTGAHVIQNMTADELEIRCGEWDATNRGFEEPLPHQIRTGKRMVLHPDFNSRTKYNNFGLIFVNENFRPEPHVHPVCLPSPDHQEDWSSCVGNGWGRVDIGESYATVLKKVNLPLVNFDSCESRLKSTALGRFFKLHKSFICAGGEVGEDLCESDGGGPLTCKSERDGSLYQLGITSLGYGCNLAVPALYADVQKAACWIDEQVSCNLEQEFEEFETFRTSSYFGFDSCPKTCRR